MNPKSFVRVVRRTMPTFVLAFAASGCFDFNRRLDPCGFDENSAECLSDGGAHSGGSASGGSDSGGNGTGGASTGGTGGNSSGGSSSGGNPSGGSASGGSASGGTGGGENVRVVVNEIYRFGSAWVELYNAGTDGAALAGWSLRTGTSGGPNYSKNCPLTGTLEPGEFLVAQAGVSGCEFDLVSGIPSSTVYLLDDTTVVHESKYPDSDAPSTPTSGQSWQAVPDGSLTFYVDASSQGVSNE